MIYRIVQWWSVNHHQQPAKERYWSNDIGWVTDHTFDRFTEEERNKLNLPVGGRWVEYDAWGDDFTQFARLISEVEASGALDAHTWECMCESMGLTEEELGELVGRAQKIWDEIKRTLPTTRGNHGS